MRHQRPQALQPPPILRPRKVFNLIADSKLVTVIPPKQSLFAFGHDTHSHIVDLSHAPHGKKKEISNLGCTCRCSRSSTRGMASEPAEDVRTPPLLQWRVRRPVTVRSALDVVREPVMHVSPCDHLRCQQRFSGVDQLFQRENP